MRLAFLVPWLRMGVFTAQCMMVSALGKVLDVCTSNRPPFTECSGSEMPVGFGVEVFTQAANIVGLRAGRDYRWQCVTYESMMTGLTGGNTSVCDAAVGGIMVSASKAQGILFSHPYYVSYLGAVVRATKNTSGWGFLRPFSGTLWAAIAATVLLVPVFMAIIEWLAQQRDDAFSPRRLLVSAMDGWWAVMGHPYPAKSLAARFFALMLGIAALVITATYTADLASILTAERLSTAINSLSDLRGGTVVTNTAVYTDVLESRYGVSAIVSNSNSMEKELEGVGRGFPHAALGDLGVLVYNLCKIKSPLTFRVIPDYLLQYDYAIAFHNGTALPLVNAFSAAIIDMQSSGELYSIQASTIGNWNQVDLDSECGSFAGPPNGTVVYLSDAWGLFVLLATAGCVGMLCAAVARGFRVLVHRRRSRSMASLSALPSP